MTTDSLPTEAELTTLTLHAEALVEYALKARTALDEIIGGAERERTDRWDDFIYAAHECRTEASSITAYEPVR